MNKPWKVQIHGKVGAESFEISVINTEKCHPAQLHYGWYDDNKVMICHSGGPCRNALIPAVWHHQIGVAEAICADLNITEP